MTEIRADSTWYSAWPIGRHPIKSSYEYHFLLESREREILELNLKYKISTSV